MIYEINVLCCTGDQVTIHILAVGPSREKNSALTRLTLLKRREKPGCLLPRLPSTKRRVVNGRKHSLKFYLDFGETND